MNVNALIYNVAVFVGVLFVGVGVGMEKGVAHALTVVGGLVIALTLFGALIATRRG